MGAAHGLPRPAGPFAIAEAPPSFADLCVQERESYLAKKESALSTALVGTTVDRVLTGC